MVEFPGLLSIVIGSVSLSHSVSVSLSLLQPPGPDKVHCSLHGNCITLSVSLLPPVLLLGSSGSFCCSALLSHLIYLCRAPAALLLLLLLPVALSGNRLVNCVFWWSSASWMEEAGGEIGQVFLLYDCVCTGCHGLLVMLYCSYGVDLFSTLTDSSMRIY